MNTRKFICVIKLAGMSLASLLTDILSSSSSSLANSLSLIATSPLNFSFHYPFFFKCIDSECCLEHSLSRRQCLHRMHTSSGLAIILLSVRFCLFAIKAWPRVCPLLPVTTLKLDIIFSNETYLLSVPYTLA